VQLKCFAPISVGHVQTLILLSTTVWLTIFCVLVLYDFDCNMDRGSVINDYY